MIAALERLESNPLIQPSQILFTRASGAFNPGATVDHHAAIGDHVHIAPGVHLGGEVRVGDGALVGIGAVVLPRVSIGAWCTVGAGAIVTRDVPPGVTVAGAPARPLPVRETV